MPQYRVMEKSFIGNRLVEPGEIVDYDGEVSSNLQPVKKGQKVVADAAIDPSQDANLAPLA